MMPPSEVQLVELAHARSGDKGDRCDLSLFANDAATYRHLRAVVTSARVQDHFADLGVSRVTRYELDGIWALKFVLDGALQGGAARSLRSDNLGKTLSARLLRLVIPAPDATNAL